VSAPKNAFTKEEVIRQASDPSLPPYLHSSETMSGGGRPTMIIVETGERLNCEQWAGRYHAWKRGLELHALPPAMPGTPEAELSFEDRALLEAAIVQKNPRLNRIAHLRRAAALVMTTGKGTQSACVRAWEQLGEMPGAIDPRRHVPERYYRDVCGLMKIIDVKRAEDS
jgi:hypothetical protein